MKILIETETLCACGKKQHLKLSVFPTSKKVQYVCTECDWKAPVYTSPSGFNDRMKADIKNALIKLGQAKDKDAQKQLLAEVKILEKLQRVVAAIFEAGK